MNTNVIYDLSPKTYYYNTDPSAGIQVGYIAEEVSELNKHFATYDSPDGNPVAINYNAVVVFLVEEVKKLKHEITFLKTTETYLKTTVTALQTTVTALQTTVTALQTTVTALQDK
jgi:hypothetical protein